MRLLRRGLLAGAAATAAAAAAVIPLTTTANASTDASTAGTKVVVNTDSYGHMDTTNVSGSATFNSPNGPVWAIDSLREKWTITACSVSSTCTADNDGANYAVTLNVGPKIDGGSQFSEFANPGPENASAGITSNCPAPGGGPREGTGKITGTIEYDVNSSAGPDLASVPAVQAPDTSLDTVLSQIFDNNTNTTPLVVGGGHYSFSYANVCGAVYTQAG